MTRLSQIGTRQANSILDSALRLNGSLSPSAQPPQRRGIDGKVWVPFSVVLVAVILILGQQWLALNHREQCIETNEKVLNAERETLRAQQSAFTSECDAFRAKVTARETQLQALRDRQISRVNRARAEGDFIGAAMILLNLAEDIEASALDNKELVLLFRRTLYAAIDEAKIRQVSNTPTTE